MDDGDRQLSQARAAKTFFAPAARSSAEMVAAQVARVVDHPVVRTVLESFGGYVLVLNQRMRLLGEQYLGGAVCFTTSAADGTAFQLVLPAF